MEVLRILQNYVDELDGCIGRGTEDFLIIQVDIRTRMQYLSLPLENLDVFDDMLMDRNFRLAMVDYNEQIEHAIKRFTAAVKDTRNDIQKGKEAVGALWHYIGDLDQTCDGLPADLNAICTAMLANLEGWNAAFGKLQKRGSAIKVSLFQLGVVVVEMQRRVGVASRRSVKPSKLSRAKSLFDKRRTVSSPGGRAQNKPLPRDPSPSKAIPARSVSEGIENPKVRADVPNSRAAEARGSAQQPDLNKSSDGPQAQARPDAKHARKASKRLQKPIPATAQTNTTTENTQQRPATAIPRSTTAPHRTLKGRSASLEQLRGHLAAKKTQPAQQPAPEPSTPTPTITKRDTHTLKDQFLHYLGPDKIDTWVTTTHEKRRPSQKLINGPLSIFRARTSSGGIATSEPSEAIFFEKGQMTWLDDGPELLNTYFLKPKPDSVPRLHGLPDQPVLVEAVGERKVGKDGQNGRGYGYGEKEDGSITALPTVQPEVGHQGQLGSTVVNGNAGRFYAVDAR